ncbi:hypothetical protein V2P20_11465 [Methylobacter sp. Wu1]|uniref:hypothetical protein n=1 Tax=Methylobacter sp. Wu1 TaxID=3119359 RepID=UPI002F923408
MALTLEQHLANADDFAEIAHRVHQIQARLKQYGGRYTREVDILSALDPDDRRYAPSALRNIMRDLSFDYQRLCSAMHATPEEHVYSNLVARYQSNKPPVADEPSRRQKAKG